MTFLSFLKEYYSVKEFKIMQLWDKKIYFALREKNGQIQLGGPLDQSEIEKIVGDDYTNPLFLWISRRLAITRILIRNDWLDARMYEWFTGPDLIKKLYPEIYRKAKEEEEKQQNISKTSMPAITEKDESGLPK